MMMRPRSRPEVFLALVLALSPAGVRAQATRDAETHFNTGLAHLQDGRVELAIDEFKAAIKQDGKNAYFYKGLGLAYAKQNREKEAVESFRKALEINPYYADVRNDLGTALILSGRKDEGRKEFLAAFDDPMNPTPEISARNLGQAYYEDKNYAQASSWFQSSIARNKAYPDAYLGLSDCLLVLGKVDEAIEKLELGVKNVPGDLDLVVALGQAYARAGRFIDARSRLEQVAGKDPAGPLGRRALELLKNLPK